ncbi:hypothetical protein [Pseudomonas aeruginosa]|uniref:hypothetical protein n=1 Tax=Pseudomonas aeruginosa TaxID=287 RepID=UPI00137AFE9C|nr:hypothetical protein [Pseudomonas aeruginosa]EKU2273745.1 hypothetical protein [Pseudomonas aeruginosa]MBI8935819.1 hypothetical protein [Pseudomonas aeruginosa]HBO4397871.1 hypothetical protein [Pseudomonas aeruginosa]HCF0281236.1 hypothetical protein [Pseudomonas aeruginosa]HCF0951508.1 hypothetical protein [Pseudomonas aeruginosa]
MNLICRPKCFGYLSGQVVVVAADNVAGLKIPSFLSSDISHRLALQGGRSPGEPGRLDFLDAPVSKRI